MRRLGHNMQVVGLVVLPLGMLLQLASAISLGQMLTMLLAGVACSASAGSSKATPVS